MKKTNFVFLLFSLFVFFVLFHFLYNSNANHDYDITKFYTSGKLIRFGDKIKVIDGFYTGQTGIVKDKPFGGVVRIKLDEDKIFVIIMSYKIEKINEK